MIALLLAMQIAAGGITILPGQTVMISGFSASTQSRAVKTVEAGEVAILRAPPCPKPTTWTATRTDCTEWEVEQPVTMVMPDGFSGRMDHLTAIPAPARGGRTFSSHGATYLNTGGGQALLMSAGRCSYSTEWHGKFYADQDFDRGAGVGQPRKGSKPC